MGKALDLRESNKPFKWELASVGNPMYLSHTVEQYEYLNLIGAYQSLLRE